MRRKRVAVRKRGQDLRQTGKCVGLRGLILAVVVLTAYGDQAAADDFVLVAGFNSDNLVAIDLMSGDAEELIWFPATARARSPAVVVDSRAGDRFAVGAGLDPLGHAKQVIRKWGERIVKRSDDAHGYAG